MNKKGNAGVVLTLIGIFLFMMFVFVLSITTGLFKFAIDSTYNALIENSDAIQNAVGDSNNATQIIDDSFGKVRTSYESMKWLTVMLIMGMFISILMLNFLVRLHPAWFMVYFFIGIVALVMSFPMANTYEQIYANPDLASSYTGFFGMNFITLNLPYWVAGLFFLGGIIMLINMVRANAGSGGLPI